MKFTSASVATLFMLGVASASPTGQFRSVLPLSPLERRGIDCYQDEDHHKCVCDACEDMETFQVGTPSVVPDDACSTQTMPVVRLMHPGGVTGWTCKKRNDEKFHACCAGEEV